MCWLIFACLYSQKLEWHSFHHNIYMSDNFQKKFKRFKIKANETTYNKSCKPKVIRSKNHHDSYNAHTQTTKHVI